MAATAAKMGIQVEWIDKIVDEIEAKRDHFSLLHEAWKLSKRIEELEREKEQDGYAREGSTQRWFTKTSTLTLCASKESML